MRKKYYGQLNIHLKDLLTLDMRKTKFIEMQIHLHIQRQSINFCTTLKSFVGQKQEVTLEEKVQTKKTSLLKPSMEQRK